MKPNDKEKQQRKDLLNRLEKVIKKGLSNWFCVGESLCEIRKEELYQDLGFTTFEEYCNKRWNISRQHSNRLMVAFRLEKKVSPTGDKSVFKNERTARRFGKLNEDDQNQLIKRFQGGEDDIETLMKEYENKYGITPSPPHWDEFIKCKNKIEKILDNVNNNPKFIDRLEDLVTRYNAVKNGNEVVVIE